MNEIIVHRILEAFSFKSVRILPLQKGYRNTVVPVVLASGEHINLIIFKREIGSLARIRRANQLMRAAAAAGLPVRAPKDRQILRLTSGATEQFAALYNYLPGTTVPWEAYTKHHLKLAGMAMSSLHAALKKIELPSLPNAATEQQVLLTRMQVYFADKHVQVALRQKCGLQIAVSFSRFKTVLDIAEALLPRQPLHLDFVRGNLLFRPAQPGDIFTHGGLALSGIIDFEKAAIGHPMFDVARTLAFSLVDCKRKTSTEIEKYFLRTGYNKHGPQQFTNVLVNGRLSLLDELTSFFLLHDFYKFLRHNPYESLHQNEHFVRTRDILIARKMLRYNHI